jgi:hypothetical protein
VCWPIIVIIQQVRNNAWAEIAVGGLFDNSVPNENNDATACPTFFDPTSRSGIG